MSKTQNVELQKEEEVFPKISRRIKGAYYSGFTFHIKDGQKRLDGATVQPTPLRN